MGIFGENRARWKKNYWRFHRFLEKWVFLRLWEKCQKCGKYVNFAKFEISQCECFRVRKVSMWSVLGFLKEFNRLRNYFFKIIPLLRSIKGQHFSSKCPKIVKMLKNEENVAKIRNFENRKILDLSVSKFSKYHCELFWLVYKGLALSKAIFSKSS